jgi:hypothetical protein
MEGRGGGEAQGVTDPKKKLFCRLQNSFKKLVFGAQLKNRGIK